MRRVDFLRGFLVMFDNPTVRITRETNDVVEAHVTWPDGDTPQDICWQITDTRLPDPLCLEIASVIASHHLLDIKDLTVLREELYDLMLKEKALGWSYQKFQRVFDELLAVRIPAVYNGRETDAFFIHESKPPNAEERRDLERIRRRNIGTLVLFLLYLPVVILYSRFFPSTTWGFAVLYIVFGGVCSLVTVHVKCPRCGDYFNMRDPWKLDNVLFEWRGRPFNHCQNCDLHL